MRVSPRLRRLLRTGLLGLLSLGAACAIAQTAPSTAPSTVGDEIVLDAREALRKRDGARLLAARDRVMALKHPLAPWVDYWELTNRLREADVAQVEAFYDRWKGSYVEDRLRNDWLLELGRRRNWEALRADFPRFRMNDDREVTCYVLVAEHLDGRDVTPRALDAWLAQRDADEGCHLLARTLLEAGQLREADVWRKAQLATEQGRQRSARLALDLLNAPTKGDAGLWWDRPERTLDRPPAGRRPDGLDVLAVARLAASDPERAARRLEGGMDVRLPADAAAWAWAQTARQSALRLDPRAVEQFERAQALADRAAPGARGSSETLAWQVRAALRANPARWTLVRSAIDAMDAGERRDPAWVYWRARADLALAPAGEAGEAQRERARQAMASIAGQLHFYGKLAAEDLGRPLVLPPPPAVLTAAERDAARANPGLARALHAIGLGLRSEGVREWNFTLRGMGDRELLAAAQLACDRQVWDRCITASERTRDEVDMAQRFPTPFRDRVVAVARDTGLDPAYVYGLIRQESRFVIDARSSAGASGLMQLMPATARWTAKRLGLSVGGRNSVNELDTNLTLGTAYLKLLLDDFGASPPLATAAYNAGPGRPRRWREGPELEPAIWAESIPFAETRDYVKKVLSNAAYYGALLTDAPLSLKARLGPAVGPRPANAPAADGELP